MIELLWSFFCGFFTLSLIICLEKKDYKKALLFLVIILFYVIGMVFDLTGA
jgi:hypothetical protein